MDRKLDDFGDTKILLRSRGLRTDQLGILTFGTYPFKYLCWNLADPGVSRPNSKQDCLEVRFHPVPDGQFMSKAKFIGGLRFRMCIDRSIM